MVCESTISSAPGGLQDPARHQTPLTRHRRRRTCGLGGPGRARWKITASGPFESFHNVGWPGILIMTTRPGERDGAGQTSLGTLGRGAARPRVGAAAGRASACTPKITASGLFGSSNNLGWPGILIMTRRLSTTARAVARQTAPPATPEHGQSRAAGDTRARQTLAPATPRRGGSVAHGAVDAQGRSALPDFRTPATGSRCYNSARVVLASVSSSANAPRIASSESLTCEASVTPSVSTPASAAVVLNSNSLA
jgi:hypothetical protein